jgi:hypothetical protein
MQTDGVTCCGLIVLVAEACINFTVTVVEVCINKFTGTVRGTPSSIPRTLNLASIAQPSWV